MYAVNVSDLIALKQCHAICIIGMLLADFVSPYQQNTVITNKSRLDSAAVLLEGPAANDQKRVEALIAFLQTSLGPRQLGRRIRCYRRGVRGGWSEIRP